MSTTDVRGAVIDVLHQIAPEVDATVVGDDAPLREALDLDSMDFLNLVIGLHKKLEIDIPESDYPKLQTLRGAVSYLLRKLDQHPL